MAKLTKHDGPSEETADLAAQYVLGGLADIERSEFEQHLSGGCPVCDAEVARVSSVVRSLAEAATPIPPAGMRERMQARIATQSLAGKSTLPGILLNESGVLIARSESMAWQENPIPGIWIKQLFQDPEEHSATSLIRMDAGSRYPSHRHAGPEEVFLLQGDLVVEGLSLKPGDYCNAQPSTVHHETYTEAGCLFILRASELDELLT